MKSAIALAAALLLAPSAYAACQGGPLDHPQKRLLGKAENPCTAYDGKVVLVVNTASMCGYTPQYEGLEKLYRAKKDQGLVVLGFPSDQFGGQEYEDDAKIQSFCQANYGVSFPMYGKTAVKGDDANPLFKDLASATGKAPSWNFSKYLVGKDGKVIGYYPSRVKPDSDELTAAIEQALK